MRCSNCSEEVKSIVAVDIDGTLGDYHGHFLRFLDNYFDLFTWPGHYTGLIPFSQWCMEKKGISLEQYREAKLAYRQGGMKRSMPIFDGAQALCGAIRDAGAELWLTTTRPYLSLDGVVKDTYEWLRRHEIECDGLLFDDDKYATLAERVDKRRVVAIFDDLREFLVSAARIFRPDVTILVRGHYNRAVSFPVSCDLDAAAAIASWRIRQWRSNIGF